MPKLARIAACVGVAAQYVHDAVMMTGIVDMGVTPTQAPTVDLTFTLDTDATTIVVDSYRHSTDGTTWSDWTSPAADGRTLEGALSRYIQLRVRFHTTDTRFTPALSTIIFEVDQEMTVHPRWDWNGGGRWA